MEMRFKNFKFFSYIRTQFGINTCDLLKDFIKLTNRSITLRIRIRFLKSCKALKLIPPHLDVCNKWEGNLYLFNDSSKKRLRWLIFDHVKAVLCLELEDSYRQLKSIGEKIFKVYKKITKWLPWRVTSKFFGYQDKNNSIKWATEIKRINKKIDWLIVKRNEKIRKDIKPIKYYYTDMNRNELRISLDNGANNKNEINVSPDGFKLNTLLNQSHKNWFVNLSNKTIPDEVTLLLQLGEKFSLPILKNDKEKTSVEFIKSIERNVFKEVDIISSQIRNQSIPIIKRVFKSTHNLDVNEKMVLSWLKHTREFARKNPDILFTKADKGNATVSMDLAEYKNKMIEIFSDSNTYMVIKKDPIKKLSNQLRNVLSGWLKKEYIDLHTYKRLLITDGTLPKAYGLPKLHKTGCPLRIIISSLNSPLYKLADYLHKIIKCSVPEARSSVGNSFKLVENLNGKFLGPRYTLASLDVVSLFTNVPFEYVYEAISNRWHFVEHNTAMSKEEFIDAIKLVLESTFFTFDKIIYKQIFGTPMGSPLSPIIADLVLQDLETKAIERLPLELPLYYRYVDDVLLAAPVDKLEEIVEIFNSFHNRIQFTLEIGINNKINFLDVTIILNDQKIMFDRYEKPTNTGRYINYFSQHPLSQKKSIVYGLVDRTVLLSHPQFHEKNLKHIISTLLDNYFPLPFIFSTINTRLKTLANRIATDINTYDNIKDRSMMQEKKNFFTIPYIKSISESFLPIAKKYGFDIAYTIPNTLSRYIIRGKDKIDSMAQNDCVYKINCSNCDCSYVGQTKRRLETRLKEHKSDINKKNGMLSVVSNHRLECNHEMNWNGVTIKNHPMLKELFRRWCISRDNLKV